MNELMTIKQVATRLSVSTRTVGRLIDSGQLEFFRVGGQLRFSVEMLERYLKTARKSDDA